MVYLINFRFKKDICWNEILTIVDKLKLDLKLTLASGAYPARDILGWKNYFFPSPGEWLHSIEECDYFITNSFHGVVFAVIFHKQFLYIPIRGNNVGMNDRIFSLLDTLGLKQQIYDSGNMMCVQLQNIIDWNFVDKSLAEQRKIADNFFKIKNI